MSRFLSKLVLLAVLPAGFVDARQAAARYDADLSHLPEAVAHDIESWRTRLESAVCLKVVIDVEETWRNLYALDAAGRPVVAHREHFQTHSWMTPDTVWMVIFPYEGDAVNTTTPHYQLLWKKDAATVWERTWMAEEGAYRARRRECRDPFGPEDGDYAAVSRGCVFATGTTSWLAGGRGLAERGTSVASVGLLRSPNIAIVPPDPSEQGVWLDVFSDALVRDLDPEDDRSLYRRNDLMLLARNEAGEPEVREWRTNVLTDSELDGRRPQQITAIRRTTYTFFEGPPAELLECTAAFVEEIDGALVRPGSSKEGLTADSDRP